MMKTIQDISVCVETDVGLQRPKNEDSYQLVYHNEAGYDVDSFGRMFAVADGMGGHAGGEVASRTACEGLLEYYAGQLETGRNVDPVEAGLGRLEKVIWKIEEKISSLSEEMPEYGHMGTTLSVLVLLKGHALIAHVGDSRVYRFRNGALEQLTEDETMAQLSVEMGYLRPDEVAGHPLGHVLTQALGQEIEEVHTRMEKVEAGDIFLLCSDGLYDMVSDTRIHEILDESAVDHGGCARLVKAALDNGGKDNVTVILVEAGQKL